MHGGQRLHHTAHALHLPGSHTLMHSAAMASAGASGGRHSDENASVRLMWRANLMAEAYVYATAAADSPEYKQLESCHYNPAYAPLIAVAHVPLFGGMLFWRLNHLLCY